MSYLTKENRQMALKIAGQCGPVIQGIKPANLLIVTTKEIRSVMAFFENQPLICYLLYRCARWTTFIVLNEALVKAYLEDKENWSFMQLKGYKEKNVYKVLRMLKQRYRASMKKEEDFPHEIGILLGYPLSDVKAFINFNGKKYLLVGYWKVYSHVEEAIAIFDRYDLAKEKTIQEIMKGEALW